MFTDLHFICKEGEKWSEEGPNLFKTGDWQVDRDVADEAEAGGRVFLHRRQKDPAFHGGTIIEWRYAEDAEKMYFFYRDGIDYRILCPGRWARRMAVVRRNE
jgi:hypothetical protein